MNKLLLPVILFALALSGCSALAPKAEKGNVRIEFRDVATNEPIEEATIEVKVNAVSPMYSEKRIEQWSAMGTKVEENGIVELFDIQLASYVLEIHAKGYDTQKSFFDIEHGSMKEWQAMQIYRSYPSHPTKQIKFIVTVEN